MPELLCGRFVQEEPVAQPAEGHYPLALEKVIQNEGMMIQLTLYRCYWPTAFQYLKSLQASFRTESFGLLMTLDITQEQAQKIITMLPFGSVIEQIDLESYHLDNQGIDELLLYQPTEALETHKNSKRQN